MKTIFFLILFSLSLSVSANDELVLGLGEAVDIENHQGSIRISCEIDPSVKSCTILKISEAKSRNLHMHCSNHSPYCALIFQYGDVVDSATGFNFSRLASWCDKNT